MNAIVDAFELLTWHAGSFLLVIGLAAAGLAVVICIADLRR